MKWMVGKTAVWIWITAASAVVALAAGGTAQEQAEPGEKIMNSACTKCHDLRPIQMQALDTDAWTKMVNSMMEKGAAVKSDEVPVLVEFLVRKHGPVPNGA